MIRLCPKPEDAYLACQWLPAMKVGDTTVRTEELRTYGAPWLLTLTKSSFRFGPMDDPLPGIGHTLLVLEGHVLLVAWPVDVALDNSAAADDVINLLGTLGAKEATNLLNKRAYVGSVPKGSVVWVPYGYQSLTVSLAKEDGELSHIIKQPFMCLDLALACQTRRLRAVKEWNQAFIDKNAEASTWKAFGPAFKAWVEAAVVASASRRKQSLAMLASRAEPSASVPLLSERGASVDGTSALEAPTLAQGACGEAASVSEA